jgi:hypothetical protein
MHVDSVPINDQAVNDENGEVNIALDHDHGPGQPTSDTIPGVAKKFRERGQPWALIVDENYGEGSAREHAALQPRFYGRSHAPRRSALLLNAHGLIGCAMIIARSFARIHETNLKVTFFVRHHCSVGYERYLGIYRSRESCPCGSQTRATMAGLVPELLWRQWESTILFQVNPT